MGPGLYHEEVAKALPSPSAIPKSKAMLGERVGWAGGESGSGLWCGSNLCGSLCVPVGRGLMVPGVVVCEAGHIEDTVWSGRAAQEERGPGVPVFSPAVK